jgi:hypothetical protein
MTYGQVKEDPLHGLHSRQIWILWIVTCENTQTSWCMQLLLTTKRQLTIALWMPVRLSATLKRCSGPRWDSSRRALNLMEDILNSYYKCTLSAVNHKLNVSGHMLIRTFFLFWYVELLPKIYLHLSVTLCIGNIGVAQSVVSFGVRWRWAVGFTVR